MNLTTARSRAGFSLIEMIGVLAIMAIIASIVLPNALKSLDRAAIRAEASSLNAVGEQLKLFLRNKTVLPTLVAPPTVPNWTTELGEFADVSPADLAVNKRNNTRIYVTNPVTQRAMFVSSMRSTLPLPTYAQINGNFATVWDTADGAVPTSPGWVPWAGTFRAGDYLVIQRVNLAPVYATDLQNYTVTMNNNGAASVTFRIYYANGSVAGPTSIVAGGSAVQAGLRPRDRVELYNTVGALDYSYVISNSGKTFDFGGTQWLPQ